MDYVVRPGIVCTAVCGATVLIPTRSVFPEVNRILRLSTMESIVWSAVEKDLPIEELLKVFQIFYKKPDAEIRERIEKICSALCRHGYLLPRGQ